MQRRHTSRFHTIRIRGGFLKNFIWFLAAAAVFLVLTNAVGDVSWLRTDFLVAGFLKAVPSLGGGQTVYAAEGNLEALPFAVLSESMPIIETNSALATKYAAMRGGAIRVKRETAVQTAEPAAPDIYQDQSGKPVKEMDLGADGIQLRNETDFGIDVDGLLSGGLQFDLSTGGPKVLVVHTHTSEAYAPSAQYNYTPTDNVRTEDNRFNVVQVGNAITNALQAEGIETVHDESLNDYPSYNGSYTKTLGVIQENLKKYPTIEVVLDVHRDFTEQADGTQLKPTITIGGEKCAQMMLVVGTNAMGLDHDNWRHNLAFALTINQTLNETYPRLVRCVNIRNERFNQHATKGSLILEMGSQANTLEEAIRTGDYVGRAIAKVLKES